MYVPAFKCEYCGDSKAATIEGEQGVFLQCGCDEALAAWEKAHRAEVERRKRRRRRSR